MLGAAPLAAARVQEGVPQDARPDSIRLRKILEIDGEFGGLTDLAVDGRGRMYVVDFVNQEIDAFSAGGDLLHRIGRKGEGPGEFAGVRDVAISGDSLFAFDNRLKRISVFSISDAPRFAYSISVLNATGGQVSNYGILAPRAGGVLVQFVPLTDPEHGEDRKIFLRRVDRHGVVDAPPVVSVPDHEWLITTDRRYGYSVSPLPFGRKSLFQLDADDHVYHVRTDRPAVNVYTLDGRLVRSISVPAERLPVTSSDLAYLRRSYEEYIGRQAAALVFGRIERAHEDGRLPQYKPYYKDFVVEPAGRIWLRLVTGRDRLVSTPVGLVYRAEARGTSYSSWTVLSPSGRSIGTTTVEGDVQLYEVRNGTAYGISTDALGVHRIVVYEITGLEERRGTE